MSHFSEVLGFIWSFIAAISIHCNWMEKSNMHILQNIYFSVPQKKAIEV